MITFSHLKNKMIFVNQQNQLGTVDLATQEKTILGTIDANLQNA